ncbi:MAG: FHA domain-containing protein, partial [Arthrobacter sp.]
DSAPALVESLWDLLAAGPEVHEVLDAVTSASGGSLARLPWFAIVAGCGSIQVFLRGEVDLTVDLPAGPVELSGREVTTWTERRFAKADSFSLTVPGAAVASGDGTEQLSNLPLADGVVLLQGLRLDFSGATGPEDSPALPAAATTAAAAAELTGIDPSGVDLTADAEASVQDEVLAAAEADIAAGLSEHGASAETMLEFSGEDAEHDGTLHGEPDPEPEPEPSPAPERVPEPAEQELTSSYDHLWEQTVMRNIEDAAVREDADADSEPAVESGRDEPGSAEPAGGGETPEAAAAEVLAVDETVDEAAGEAAAGAAPSPASELPAAVPTGLIDSVPWHTGGDRPSPSQPPPASQPFLPPAPSPAPAAPLPPTAPQAHAPHAPAPHAPAPQSPAQQLPAPEPGADADHDGQTIMKGDLAGAGQRPGAQRPVTEPSTGPLVLARVCPEGHANPSTYSHCGRCGVPLPGDGVQVRRPRLGRMRLSTGELIDLDQSLVVGRQPSVSRVQGAVMPKLIQVASPSGDISRSHVEVRLEGWHVMLCDLKATNGTVLVREGQPPRRLAQGEMAILLDGDIAEVGDGISLRFEEIP